LYHTNATEVDTDGDGYSDKQEVDAGSDPLDPNSIPTQTTNIPGFNSLILILSLISILYIFGNLKFRFKKHSNLPFF